MNDTVTVLLMILFIIIWMYQGAQVANLVLDGVMVQDADNASTDYFIKYILLAVVVGMCWPGALALHMMQQESREDNQ